MVSGQDANAINLNDLKIIKKTEVSRWERQGRDL